ncbi:MAG: histidine kinase [Myxococcota bacterium]
MSRLPGRDEEEFRAYMRDQTAEFDANMRSPQHLFATLLVIIGVPFLLLIPAAESVIGVSFREAAWIVFPTAAVVIVTTLAYHRWGGRSRIAQALDHLETISVQVSLAGLILVSGEAVSPVWSFYLAHGLIVSVRPSLSRSMVAMVAAMPLVVAGVFLALEGAGADFFASFFAALMGGLTMSFTSGLQGRLGRLAFERGVLEKRVSELEVEGERRRIARDLHDGLTADLTAIAWRAEVLTKSPQDENPVEELAAIAQRARAAIDDTRSVVWALRSETVRWSALTDHVHSRCTELCRSKADLQLEMEPSDKPVGGQLAVDIVRIVQELVRNALRHGSPETVHVRLELGEVISVTVDDDGVGFPVETANRSGLSNVERRTADHSGEMHIARLEPGTRVQVTLPLVA